MSHQEMIVLKLQMGISPTANIPPNILLAMWQELMLESTQKRCNQSNTTSSPNKVALNPIII